MFSRAISSHRLLLRVYSSPRIATMKLWIKPTGGLPTQVPIRGCTDIDDFAQRVRQELSVNCQVAVFSSLDKKPLDPRLAIKDLLKTDDFKNNSGESPLFVKLFPPVGQDATASKTIYIRDVGSLDSYTEFMVESDADIKRICEAEGLALYLVSEPAKLLTKFTQLKHGEKYDVFSRYEQVSPRRSRGLHRQYMALNTDVARDLKKYLRLHVGSNVIDMPPVVRGTGGKVVQEWAAAYKVDDVLYLCDAAQFMSSDKVLKIAQKIKTFTEDFQPHAHEEFSLGINKVVGVACATHFPPVLRNEARDLGLICLRSRV